MILTLLAGTMAGCLGAMLGIGGGVLIVPLLDIGLGLPFRTAAGVSLIGVLATSSSMAASTVGRQLLNVRLAVFLLLFSVSGASLGAVLLGRLPAEIFPRLFGVVAAVIAAAMFVRLDRRNVIADTAAVTGVFDGRLYDEDTRTDVAYRVRRLPFAAGGAFVAGILASFIGIGGGILIVPLLNAWCGVPMRIAAATSAFMIGITAVPGAVQHWTDGHLGGFELAGAAAAGVLMGFPVGQWVSARAPVRWLKLVMAGILAIVAAEYLLR
jgi:uncharacterized membrane protein YfcA